MNKTSWCALLLAFGIPAVSVSQSIVTTAHNMSVSGPGAVKATTEEEICIFCHTPHHSRPQAPLWNRNDPGSTYVLYNSSTTQAAIGQPDGSSILCLSCHDGTIALGNVISRATPITFTSGATTMPVGKSNLETDLSNDHPVSFLFNSALSTADGELKNPSTLTGPVKLENSKLQCTSCHDPHKDLYSDFLVASSQNSNLCLNCHQKNFWVNTTHNTSTKTWNGTAPNPWFHTQYTTVSENACENCHNPHNAGGKPRLLKYATEETNCYDCHNGNVAAKNIQAEFSKPYRHNVAGYNGIHDPTEAVLAASQHVECADCHNSHAASGTSAVAPNVNGFLAGVKGITQGGAAINPAQFEYEICYRCHSSNSWAPAPATSRLIVQNNISLKFATTNPSFHPVVGPRNNAEITSNLISPNTASTVVYCSACHAGNGTGSPAGPHGSTFPQILKYQYLKDDGARSTNGTIESASAYALCYSCHNRNNIINDINTFPEHKLHIISENAPCNTCHDPHGVSGTATNNSNLINFRTGIVTPSQTGSLRFEDLGARKGRCYLTCHGQDHDPKSY